MAKRQPRPEPFSIAELEEIAQSPALQGFEKVLQYRPLLVVQTPASTVEGGVSTTVEEVPASTVEGSITSTVEGDLVAAQLESPLNSGARLWIAEDANGVFTASRIKRIRQAQDALTHVEEAVYDALWGAKTKGSEPYRLAKMGYSELAKRSRVSKRSIQSVIDRLLAKRFIQIETPADITTRTATVYRVLGYGAMLKFMRDTGREYVVRTGRGVFFVRPASLMPQQSEVGTPVPSLSSTVEDGRTSTVEDLSSSTVEDSVASTVAAGAPARVEGPCTPSSPGTSSVSAVANRIVKLLPVDDDAVRSLMGNCRNIDPDATDDEIAHCAEMWIRQNLNNTSIRKPAAVMLVAVPKYFALPATELQRYREQRDREAEKSREVARQVLSDPQASQQEREWAHALLLP